MMVNKMNLYVHEILKKVSAKNKKADKIQVLKENESFALKTILQGTYNPGVKFLLPEGDPPYTPNRPESIPSTLEKQLKKRVNKIQEMVITILLHCNMKKKLKKI